ncbi:MAG TPA: allophanate hydrolase [Burkholderiaceae bacterium]
MIGWAIQDWLAAYKAGATPEALLSRLAGLLPQADKAWISLADQAHLGRQVAALHARAAAAGGAAALPLYGVPFAVKDNIDVAGLPTTAGCPEFAYIPEHNAYAVERLIQAGAVVIGKTNLDQFATGLVGTRSPYGAVPNAFDPAYISGGSSSGSASVVARGLVPFSFGTDTAGSGRVPAGLNNIVGLKPTRGALSNSGVVPACRSLDCISIFATTVDDAQAVHMLAAGRDEGDAFSRAAPAESAMAVLPERPRFGVPLAPEFYGDAQSEAAWRAALAEMMVFGAQCVPLDFDLFDQVAALLYDGPWVAERYAAIRAFAEKRPDAIHPVVRDIIFRAKEFSAAEAFNAMYRLGDLKRKADAMIAQVDALLVPTLPRPHRIADVEADPVRLNSQNGKYTNFVNLLDWSALALPCSFRADGLPFGITLVAPAWKEAALCAFGKRWQGHRALPRGATGLAYVSRMPVQIPAPASGKIRLAVVGAHLTGMPLNRELTERDAVLVETTVTSDAYRLYALAGTVPPKPGLARGEAGSGAAIQVELWDMPTSAFGSFVAGIPAPLGIGTLELADGRTVKGFICEGQGLAGAQDITHFGGWRAYRTSLA